jgi:hypothetical protein
LGATLAVAGFLVTAFLVIPEDLVLLVDFKAVFLAATFFFGGVLTVAVFFAAVFTLAGFLLAVFLTTAFITDLSIDVFLALAAGFFAAAFFFGAAAGLALLDDLAVSFFFAGAFFGAADFFTPTFFGVVDLVLAFLLLFAIIAGPLFSLVMGKYRRYHWAV